MAAQVHRYNVGAIEVTVLSDGYRMVPVDEKYIRNARLDDIKAELAAAGLPTEAIKNTYSPVVLTTGGRRVLIDTGNGEPALKASNGERGTLGEHLAAAGIAHDAIDVVMISHFHADHVNGLLTADNRPAFPNAEIKVPEVEWKFWMDDGAMSRATPGRMTELFANNRRVFDALGRKVTPYAWDEEVVPGVIAVGTPGHSIGHTSYIVASGGQRVFVQQDVCNNFVLFTRHPGWHGFFDQDPAQAEATRRRIYDMLAADRLPVQAYHFPFPALMAVEKAGDGYRVTPTTV